MNLFKCNKIKNSAVQQGNNNTNNNISVCQNASALSDQNSDTKAKYQKPKLPFEHNLYALLGFIFLLAVLFFGLAIWAYIQWDIGLSGDSIVLAFVGILATFVVVSNYVQLKRTEDKIDVFESDLYEKAKDAALDVFNNTVKDYVNNQASRHREALYLKDSETYREFYCALEAGRAERYCYCMMRSVEARSFVNDDLAEIWIKGQLHMLIPAIERIDISNHQIVKSILNCATAIKANGFDYEELKDIERILKTKINN